MRSVLLIIAVGRKRLRVLSSLFAFVAFSLPVCSQTNQAWQASELSGYAYRFQEGGTMQQYTFFHRGTVIKSIGKPGEVLWTGPMYDWRITNGVIVMTNNCPPYKLTFSKISLDTEKAIVFSSGNTQIWSRSKSKWAEDVEAMEAMRREQLGLKDFTGRYLYIGRNPP